MCVVFAHVGQECIVAWQTTFLSNINFHKKWYMKYFKILCVPPLPFFLSRHIVVMRYSDVTNISGTHSSHRERERKKEKHLHVWDWHRLDGMHIVPSAYQEEEYDGGKYFKNDMSSFHTFTCSTGRSITIWSLSSHLHRWTYVMDGWSVVGLVLAGFILFFKYWRKDGVLSLINLLVTY